MAITLILLGAGPVLAAASLGAVALSNRPDKISGGNVLVNLFQRFMAGLPLSNDVVKCRLRELDLADYHVSLTPAEQARLEAIFPDGVCDYSRTGVDQVHLLSTWITYTDVGKYRPDPGDND